MGKAYNLTRQVDHWLGEFVVMASTCQILLDDVDAAQANRLVALAYTEAKRIEVKYSRFRDGNIIASLNHAKGRTVQLDDETVKLINLADLCFRLSDGLFDISAGALGKLWHFKQQTTLPSDVDINALLPHIGWQQVQWQAPLLTLPAGMQVDLGGIGKEYAVDKVALLLENEMRLQQIDSAFLVNFGGDIYANRLRRNGVAWQVAIEDPQHLGKSKLMVSLGKGGLASSGNSQRFIDVDGQRYSHILNPQTGYPVADGPAQVTVYAQNCVQAGMLATIALLQGEFAEDFLKAQDCRYWL
ncbi:FAD:protein FMN transferase [Moritella sp. F3]|uniref:FAD:protein FMN transferase n=1 Tax=Moritella sp. F3 TaxID=2718882 RepID=UPI0018E1A80C|nr:FAD:protein FMN transferase [Moritella sp. F3]GIC75786.1 FAD:protein FMN transferase [Moritella sp. F1]GIC81766.1 FAD:protein FMN transferase [Moritella sp. F3]